MFRQLWFITSGFLRSTLLANSGENKIYLDFNASTPVAPEVLEAMARYVGGFVGNPSSEHWACLPG